MLTIAHLLIVWYNRAYFDFLEEIYALTTISVSR